MSNDADSQTFQAMVGALNNIQQSVAAIAAGLPTIRGQIPGTTTNDNAAAGRVGEYPSSPVAFVSAVGLTTGAGKTITSLSLTPGDWDVTINGQFATALTTSVTVLGMSISFVTDTMDFTPGRFNNRDSAAFVPGVSTETVNVGPYRVSLAVTTTIYMVALGGFTVSTLKGWGLLSARRMR